MNAVEEMFPEEFERMGPFLERLREAQRSINPKVRRANEAIAHRVERLVRGVERATCSSCAAPLAIGECDCGFCMSCHEVVVGEQGLVARCPVRA